MRSESGSQGGSAAAPVVATAADGAVAAAPRGRHVTHLAFHDRICALTSDHELRCWGNRDATPVEVETPAPFVRVGYQYGIDAANNLYRRRGSWDKPIANVRAFADSGASRYAVTVFGDGKIEVVGEKAHLPATATGDWLRTATIAGVADAVDVISMRWTLGMKHHHVSCALQKSGSVACWFEDLEPVFPVPEIVATQLVEADGEHVCVLDREREVKCWEGHIKQRKPKVTTMPGWKGARMIAGGGSSNANSPQGRVCAVFEDGGVSCAEVASYYIGKPKIDPPKRIEGLPPVVSVFVGDGFACAIVRDDGGVMCWGDNQLGQLGDGTLTDRDRPVRVKYLLDDKLPPAENGHGKEQQSTIEQDWSALPAKCTRPTAAFGMPIVSAYATRTATGSIRAWLASYRMDPKTAHHDPRGSQQKLELGIDHSDPVSFAKRELDLKPYTYSGKARSVWARRYTGQKLGLRADKPLVAGDRFDPTVIDDTWLCGTLRVDQGKTAIAIAARMIDH